MDWFKAEETKDTPSRALPFYRKLKGLTQPELTEMLGTTKQFISNIKNNRKPISKMLATKLGLRSDSTIIIAGSEKKKPPESLIHKMQEASGSRISKVHQEQLQIHYRF